MSILLECLTRTAIDRSPHRWKKMHVYILVQGRHAVCAVMERCEHEVGCVRDGALSRQFGLCAPRQAAARGLAFWSCSGPRWLLLESSRSPTAPRLSHLCIAGVLRERESVCVVQQQNCTTETEALQRTLRQSGQAFSVRARGTYAYGFFSVRLPTGYSGCMPVNVN